MYKVDRTIDQPGGSKIMYEIAVCGGRKQERDKLIERIWERKSELELCIYEYNSGEELLEGMRGIGFSLI